jgi:excisionase family DNA binding protein
MSSNGITIQITLPESLENLLPQVKTFLDKFDGSFSQPQSPGLENQIMSPEEVCRDFKINKTKLYALTMQTGAGAIPRFKVGRDLRFLRSEVQAWFKTHKVV